MLVDAAAPGGQALGGAEYRHVGAVVDKAIDAEIQYKIPAESVLVDRQQWDNLMAMQKYLKNVKGTTTFERIVDNSFAEKAVKAA